MTYYSKDPRWIHAKYAGKCSRCGDKFEVATRVFYYPLHKDILSGKCAEAASKEFEAMAQDEDMYNSHY